jgi:hypothetical protein
MLARSGLQPNLPTQSVAQMRCIKPMRQFDIEAVRNTDGTRLKGRRRMRAGNKQGDFVSTQQPGEVSTHEPRGAK